MVLEGSLHLASGNPCGKQEAEEVHKSVFLAAVGRDHDPHPAQPACWSANLSQHPDFLGAGPPCLQGTPVSTGVFHGTPPRAAPDRPVPLGLGNTAQMGGGKS